jgi:hypothetical protein
MEALTAAIFYLVIQRPNLPPLKLEHPLPLSECLDETRLALNRNYDIEDGAHIQAGCIVTVAPSIQH